MALTQTDLDALDKAIAGAELTVELEGRRVTYRSTSDLISARAHVATQLAAANMKGSVPRRGTFQVRFTTSRGY